MKALMQLDILLSCLGGQCNLTLCTTDVSSLILLPFSPTPAKQKEEDLTTIHPKKEETEEKSEVPDGPDTSSFTAFLISLLSSSKSGNHPTGDPNEHHAKAKETISTSASIESSGRISLFTRGRRTLRKVINKTAKIRAAYEPELSGNNLRPVAKDDNTYFDLPDMSEQSMLLSDDIRAALYSSLPALVKGTNWVLLYSTRRHGISLSLPALVKGTNWVLLYRSWLFSLGKLNSF
ncbi:uncharacterized protein LOC141815183 [Curcuma longa]|uniref:uncharacterized protein LOC141815183 n=1 Tax=Curcuma longa TaxID=136217 RepID=UPI003D9F98C1